MEETTGARDAYRVAARRPREPSDVAMKVQRTAATGTLRKEMERPFVRDQQLLNAFWHSATTQPRHPWTSWHLPYRHIAQRLVHLGTRVEEGNRP